MGERLSRQGDTGLGDRIQRHSCRSVCDSEETREAGVVCVFVSVLGRCWGGGAQMWMKGSICPGEASGSLGTY